MIGRLEERTDLIDIAEEEKVMKETSAEIARTEEEVTKLNNVLAGRRGKTTVSDREHPFSQHTEKVQRLTRYLRS